MEMNFLFHWLAMWDHGWVIPRRDVAHSPSNDTVVLQIHQPNPSNLKMKQQQLIQFSPQKSWTMSHKKIRLPKNHRKWPAQEGVFEIRDFTNASTFERLSHQISLAARHWARALSAERSEPGKPEPLPRGGGGAADEAWLRAGWLQAGEIWWNMVKPKQKMLEDGCFRHRPGIEPMITCKSFGVQRAKGFWAICYRLQAHLDGPGFVFVSKDASFLYHDEDSQGGHGRIARLDQSSHLPSVLRYDLVFSDTAWHLFFCVGKPGRSSSGPAVVNCCSWVGLCWVWAQEGLSGVASKFSDILWYIPMWLFKASIWIHWVGCLPTLLPSDSLKWSTNPSHDGPECLEEMQQRAVCNQQQSGYSQNEPIIIRR